VDSEHGGFGRRGQAFLCSASTTQTCLFGNQPLEQNLVGCFWDVLRVSGIQRVKGKAVTFWKLYLSRAGMKGLLVFWFCLYEFSESMKHILDKIFLKFLLKILFFIFYFLGRGR
jgi:hypothetical protein